MHKATLIAVTLVVLSVLSFNSTAAQESSPTVDKVLEKVSAKLNSLKRVGYSTRIEYNYASEGYLAETIGQSFLDFEPDESPIGFRYQFSDNRTVDIYNGAERFVLKKEPKTIDIYKKASLDNLKSVTLLQFSPVMLRNALPKVLADKTITRKITEESFEERPVYAIEFVLDKRFIDSGLGSIEPMSIDRKTIYKILVERSTSMPIQIYRGNDKNGDFNRATFTSMVAEPKVPAERSWFYSTYTGEFSPSKPAKDVLIKPGEMSHEISVTSLSDGSAVAIERGKVVLLDFWIAHCGASQETVPAINSIFQKYGKDPQFQLMSMNIDDSPKLIELFQKNQHVKFPILRSSESAAKKYGIPGYPMVVLIGKDGKVIYSGSRNLPEIDKLISENLNK